jgi:carboxylesterase type B
VHGGGFAYDSATMFNDSQIVHKYASDGVVFLIPAYRLGVFGFLDLGEDRPVKRNLGMHGAIKLFLLLNKFILNIFFFN